MQSAWPWGDARICSFCAVSGATAARQEMSARAGSAACTSCRGCQPGARSSSIPAVRLHRQQGQSPAWGWQLQPRRCWKQIRSWGSRSSLPAGAEPAAPNRSRRRLPLPRAQQTDRRTAPSRCPQGASSFWGKAGRGTGSCSSPPAGEACLVVVLPQLACRQVQGGPALVKWVGTEKQRLLCCIPGEEHLFPQFP